MKASAREQFKPFDVTEYLGTAEDRAAYLHSMWEESAGDQAAMATAIGDVARAIGMSRVAVDTGVAREALYKALSPSGNPEFGTILKVLRALGLELTVQPKAGSIARIHKKAIKGIGARRERRIDAPSGSSLMEAAWAGARVAAADAARPRQAKRASKKSARKK